MPPLPNNTRAQWRLRWGDASPLLFFLRLRGLGRKFRRGRAVAAVFLRTDLFGAAALSGLEREDGPAALRALLVARLDALALGIIAAPDELAVTPATDDERRLTLGAHTALHRLGRLRLFLLAEAARVV